jgi:hypothetical protein
VLVDEDVRTIFIGLAMREYSPSYGAAHPHPPTSRTHATMPAAVAAAAAQQHGAKKAKWTTAVHEHGSLSGVHGNLLTSMASLGR